MHDKLIKWDWINSLTIFIIVVKAVSFLIICFKMLRYIVEFSLLFDYSFHIQIGKELFIDGCLLICRQSSNSKALIAKVSERLLSQDTSHGNNFIVWHNRNQD